MKICNLTDLSAVYVVCAKSGWAAETFLWKEKCFILTFLPLSLDLLDKLFSLVILTGECENMELN